jgi:hypothetical protein
MSRYYDNAPSLYEIQCENGEIDEDAWRYEPVDYEDYYMIESYKYAHDFPKEWAQNHMEGTGPEQCGNCYCYGSKDGVFLGYCLNCAKYDYNGERGPGLDLEAESEEAEGDCEGDEDECDGSSKAVSSLDPNENQTPASEPESDRMAKLIAQVKDLDYIFQIAEGKVLSDDQRSHDFFGIEKE